jgi:hypothetical protein
MRNTKSKKKIHYLRVLSSESGKMWAQNWINVLIKTPQIGIPLYAEKRLIQNVAAHRLSLTKLFVWIASRTVS